MAKGNKFFRAGEFEQADSGNLPLSALNPFFDANHSMKKPLCAKMFVTRVTLVLITVKSKVSPILSGSCQKINQRIDRPISVHSSEIQSTQKGF